MTHGDAWEGKWRGNWRMEWIASTLHTTSEYGVSSITTADAHTLAVSSRLNWRPCRFKWTRPFRRKTKSGFCACAITFQKKSTFVICLHYHTNSTGFHAIIVCTDCHMCMYIKFLKRLLFKVQNFAGGVFETFIVNIWSRLRAPGFPSWALGYSWHFILAFTAGKEVTSRLSSICMHLYGWRYICLSMASP